MVAACEVSVLRFRLSDGSEREERFDPPLAITSASVNRKFSIPASTVSISGLAKGCWLETTPYRVKTTPTVIEVWPRAMLSARFESVKSIPSAIRAAFVDVTAGENDELQEIECSTEELVARCNLPALRPIHLRLECNGFAPVYVKNVIVKEGETEQVGPAPLVPAYRVDGRVISRDGRPLRDAHVRLFPATAGEMSASERLLRTRFALTDAKGYFRIQSVEPGSYRLVSRVAGLGDAVLDPVRIADRDIQTAPVVHSGLSHIEVLLSPRVAPDSAPWHIRLTRSGTRQDESVLVAEGTVSPAGLWSSVPLSDGEYTVSVLDRFRSQMARQTVVLEGRDERAVLTISGIPVRGKLMSGEEGVAGKLTFTMPSGLRVRTETDQGGVFGCMFPAAGSWRVSVTAPPESSSTINLPEVDIDVDSTDELQLRLPAGRIHGVVVNQQGHPVEAAITARQDGRIVAQTWSAADGKFTLDHLAEAVHTVEAEGENGFAPATSADLSEKSTIEVELKLRTLQMKGVVVASSGRPLSGAVVRLFDEVTGEFEDTIADSEGLFAIPARTAGVIDVIVIAPPAPIVARRLSPAQWQGQSVTIAVPAQGAVLRLVTLRTPPWPVLTPVGGVSLSLGLFVMPRFGSPTMREFVNGAFQFFIEPGSYTLCNGSDCRPFQLQPGNEITIPFLPEHP
jgi:Carboxypeptidase regulatory-like domain